MLVCLIGVWCLCLRRPPRGYLFSCKNGRPHDACLFGWNICVTMCSWRYSCVLPWIFSSLCCHVLFGTGRYRRAVLASEKENGLFFVYCPSVWYHLFPVCENSSVAPCGCVMAGTSQGLGGVATMTTHLTPALIINVLCQKGWLLRALQMTCAVKRWW